MGGDSFLALACAGLIGILFGLVLAFAGYRFFLILLPIFGFFFGLAFGAQAIQAGSCLRCCHICSISSQSL
jgi:hypothetical protein